MKHALLNQDLHYGALSLSLSLYIYIYIYDLTMAHVDSQALRAWTFSKPCCSARYLPEEA